MSSSSPTSSGPQYSNLPFGHSMGSALTQAHIENHGYLLAGAILCGTPGAIPERADDGYDAMIQQLYTLATEPDASAPSQYLGKLLASFNAPFVANAANLTGSEWQPSDPEEIRLFKVIRSAANLSRTA
jgi:pimeloyl-ACP methyl ester carboxylesterase